MQISTATLELLIGATTHSIAEVLPIKIGQPRISTVEQHAGNQQPIAKQMPGSRSASGPLARRRLAARPPDRKQPVVLLKVNRVVLKVNRVAPLPATPCRVVAEIQARSEAEGGTAIPARAQPEIAVLPA